MSMSINVQSSITISGAYENKEKRDKVYTYKQVNDVGQLLIHVKLIFGTMHHMANGHCDLPMATT